MRQVLLAALKGCSSPARLNYLLRVSVRRTDAKERSADFALLTLDLAICRLRTTGRGGQNESASRILKVECMRLRIAHTTHPAAVRSQDVIEPCITRPHA